MTSKAQLAPFSSWQMRLVGVAAVLVLVFVTATVLYRRHGSSGEIAKQPQKENVPPTATGAPTANRATSATAEKTKAPKASSLAHLAKMPLFTAMILASENRGASAAQTITVPGEAKAIELQLGSEADIPPGHYSLLLTSAGDGKTVWQRIDLSHKQGSFLSVQTPAFPNGSYLLTATPAKTNTDSEPLNFSFTIARK